MRFIGTLLLFVWTEYDNCHRIPQLFPLDHLNFEDLIIIIIEYKKYLRVYIMLLFRQVDEMKSAVYLFFGLLEHLKKENIIQIRIRLRCL